MTKVFSTLKASKALCKNRQKLYFFTGHEIFLISKVVQLKILAISFKSFKFGTNRIPNSFKSV